MALSSVTSMRHLTLAAAVVAVLTFALFGPAGALRPAHARAEVNCEEGGDCGGDGGGGGGGGTGGGGDDGGGGGVDTGGGETGNGGDQSGGEDNGNGGDQSGNGDDNGGGDANGNGGETGTGGDDGGIGGGETGTGGDDGGIGGGETGTGGDDGGIGGGETGTGGDDGGIGSGGGTGTGLGSGDNLNQLGFGDQGNGDATHMQDPEVIVVNGTAPKDPPIPVDPNDPVAPSPPSQHAGGGIPPSKQAAVKQCLTSIPTLGTVVSSSDAGAGFIKAQKKHIDNCVGDMTQHYNAETCRGLRGAEGELKRRYDFLAKFLKNKPYSWPENEIKEYLRPLGSTISLLTDRIGQDCIPSDGQPGRPA